MRDDIKTYTANQLIEKLQLLVAEKGDLNVYLCDPGTGYQLAIGLDFVAQQSSMYVESDRDCFMVFSRYRDEPRGHV